MNQTSTTNNLDTIIDDQTTKKSNNKFKRYIVEYLKFISTITILVSTISTIYGLAALAIYNTPSISQVKSFSNNTKIISKSYLLGYPTKYYFIAKNGESNEIFLGESVDKLVDNKLTKSSKNSFYFEKVSPDELVIKFNKDTNDYYYINDKGEMRNINRKIEKINDNIKASIYKDGYSESKIDMTLYNNKNEIIAQDVSKYVKIESTGHILYYDYSSNYFGIINSKGETITKAEFNSYKELNNQLIFTDKYGYTSYAINSEDNLTKY